MARDRDLVASWMTACRTHFQPSEIFQKSSDQPRAEVIRENHSQHNPLEQSYSLITECK